MKIQGIGLPFSYHQSSCSNRTPKSFSWIEDESDIEVWVDMQIPMAIDNPIPEGKKRYAWFCESRAVIPRLRQAFDHEEIFNDIIDSYDAIFVPEKELANKHEKIHFCFAGSNLPWISPDDYKLNHKTKLTSFIASCKRVCHGHEIRHQLFEKIKENETEIDVYGSITGNPFGYKMGCHLDGNPDKRWHDKSEALNDYMFSIVIENDVYDTYFTEKLTDCFATGTIPIYYGTKSIDEYFNTDGVIFIDGDINNMYDIISNLDPMLYYGKIHAINDNLERLKDMSSADDMLYEKIKEF